MTIQLIVGLGNPGEKYQDTRHNVGWWFVDELIKHYGSTFFKENKFHGMVARCIVPNLEMNKKQEFIILKPDTFMNKSGLAINKITQYYKIPMSEVLVVHDDLDLPPGVNKLKYAGGHGGHNGLRDTIEQTGDKYFYRLRIGIGHPGEREQVIGYVLGKAPQSERVLIKESMDKIMQSLPYLLYGDAQKAMYILHSN